MVRAVLKKLQKAQLYAKQLQSFLGFENFYCQFKSTFTQIALPITNLLKTGGRVKQKASQPLNWSLECQATFEKLKCLFAAEPVLNTLTQMSLL